MTEEIPFEKLLEAMESPTLSQNSRSLMEMLREAQVFVAEVNKISHTMDQTLSLVQKYGIPVDRLVAGLCKKMNIDLYTPLQKDQTETMTTRSPLHKTVIDRINMLNEAQLITFLGEIEQLEKDKNKTKRLPAHENRPPA